MYSSKRRKSSRVTNETLKRSGSRILSHSKNQRQHHPEYEGIAQMTRDGNLFVKVEELEDDVFITSAKARGALNGDRVRIAVTEPREGNLTEIVTVLTPEKAGTQEDWDHVVTALGCIWVILLLGTWIEKRLGARGLSILMRLTALVLAALSAQMIMAGVVGFLKG